MAVNFLTWYIVDHCWALLSIQSAFPSIAKAGLLSLGMSVKFWVGVKVDWKGLLKKKSFKIASPVEQKDFGKKGFGWLVQSSKPLLNLKLWQSRFLRYKIEKGLRVVWFRRQNIKKKKNNKHVSIPLLSSQNNLHKMEHITYDKAWV